MRYKRSKLEHSIGSLWEAESKRAKIDYKNLPSPSVFEQLFQKKFRVIFDEF